MIHIVVYTCVYGICVLCGILNYKFENKFTKRRLFKTDKKNIRILFLNYFHKDRLKFGVIIKLIKIRKCVINFKIYYLQQKKLNLEFKENKIRKFFKK